jgi:acyl-CoA dehydrogenase
MSPLEWNLWPWPFFDAAHHELAERVKHWSAQHHGQSYPDMASECRAIVRSLGAAGLLDHCVPPGDAPVDVRSVCLIREALTYEHALSDAMFAMQGIGTTAIRRFGTLQQREAYLEPCRKGERIAAFALTEPEVGSDVASMTTTAVREGDDYVINGAKTLISNAGLADH